MRCRANISKDFPFQSERDRFHCRTCCLLSEQAFSNKFYKLHISHLIIKYNLISVSDTNTNIEIQIQIGRERKYRYNYPGRANKDTNTHSWGANTDTNTIIQGRPFPLCHLLCQPPVPHATARHSLECTPSSIHFIHFFAISQIVPNFTHFIHFYAF